MLETKHLNLKMTIINAQYKIAFLKIPQAF